MSSSGCLRRNCRKVCALFDRPRGTASQSADTWGQSFLLNGRGSGTTDTSERLLGNGDLHCLDGKYESLVVRAIGAGYHGVICVEVNSSIENF